MGVWDVVSLSKLRSWLFPVIYDATKFEERETFQQEFELFVEERTTQEVHKLEKISKILRFCSWRLMEVNLWSCQKFTIISLLQTLKSYAVNGLEMYCTYVFFYIWTRTVTELPTVNGFVTKCNEFYISILLYIQYLMQMTSLL